MYERIRFHTSARRVPQLIGKLPGWKLPGGPYTVAQFTTFAAIIYIGWQGWALWPTTNSILKIACIVGAGIGAVFALRALPAAPMALIHQVFGFWAVATAPAWGRSAGRSVTFKRARSVSYGPITSTPADGLPVVNVEVEADQQRPRATATAPLTDVQRRLAADLTLRKAR